MSGLHYEILDEKSSRNAQPVLLVEDTNPSHVEYELIDNPSDAENATKVPLVVVSDDFPPPYSLYPTTKETKIPMKSTPREKAFETGTPLTFLIGFLFVTIFSWLGLLLLICFQPTSVASQSGSLSGLGASFLLYNIAGGWVSYVVLGTGILLMFVGLLRYGLARWSN
ncbi:uncharacterized protein [Oscarella lobularis]|uniref:uncharacterized protein n=1 Tax=Oscarella lobularis TaxID=121494 RepID=UPI003313F21C